MASARQQYVRELNEQGAELKKLRLQKGLTQKQLADMTELNQSAISDIEKGCRPLDTNFLPALAAALGVPPEHLVELWLKYQEPAPRSILMDRGLYRPAGLETPS